MSFSSRINALGQLADSGVLRYASRMKIRSNAYGKSIEARLRFFAEMEAAIERVKRGVAEERLRWILPNLVVDVDVKALKPDEENVTKVFGEEEGS